MRAKITSVVFIIILVAFFALVMVIPKDEQASVQENRPLAEMPQITLNSVFSGEFETAFETYLTDNIGFRSKFAKLGTNIENIRGIQKEDSGRIVTLANGNQLVLNDGKIIEVFKENSQAAAQYISVLNDYSAKFGSKADMYIMLAPTQIEFDKTKYRNLADSEKKTIDRIYSSLKGYKTVNVYDKLKQNTDDYIYFKTDHHWTQRGAYLGYQSLMETKGAKAVLLEDLKVNKASGFLGYLYNQANVPEYSKYADNIEYFEGSENYTINAKGPDDNGNITEYQTNIYCHPDEDTAPTYGIFMDGDHAFAEINTNIKNGEVALVIKDSYANTVIPLLTNNYEKILVVDPRSYYATVTELVDEYDVDDVIIINYVLSTTFTDFINNIAKIL